MTLELDKNWFALTFWPKDPRGVLGIFPKKIGLAYYICLTRDLPGEWSGGQCFSTYAISPSILLLGSIGSRRNPTASPPSVHQGSICQD